MATQCPFSLEDLKKFVTKCKNYDETSTWAREGNSLGTMEGLFFVLERTKIQELIAEYETKDADFEDIFKKVETKKGEYMKEGAASREVVKAYEVIVECLLIALIAPNFDAEQAAQIWEEGTSLMIKSNQVMDAHLLKGNLNIGRSDDMIKKWYDKLMDLYTKWNIEGTTDKAKYELTEEHCIFSLRIIYGLIGFR
ncbi:hypothetical protein Ciccas_011751 [Cichlidogyrus casuarinus]|uniref:Uncharacterized protein n=1 Tax=Cichlidogyrus casuarinus TaxID=1844966 RepID=A0ABD2PQC2_9PLAT